MEQLARYYEALGRRKEATEIWDQITEDCNQGLLRDPGLRLCYLFRAAASVRRKEWSKAEEDLVKYDELSISTTDAEAWEWLSVVRCSMGDGEAYRRGCAEFLRRYAQCDTGKLAGWRVARCCNVATIPGEALEQVMAVAQESLRQEMVHVTEARLELACALYRAGRWGESSTMLRECWTTCPDEWVALWLAMALKKSGNVAHAEEYLAKSDAIVSQKMWLGRYNQLDKLRLRILRDEAAAVLQVSTVGALEDK
jgi:tetratricopeptide (TPR) repeat protein